VAGVLLPDTSEAATRRRLLARFPGAVESSAPPAIERAIVRLVALLGGERDDLADIALDWTGVPEFNRRVYEIARGVRPGATLTYGDVATRLGAPGAARAVGHALGENPFPILVPCHRVLAANGRLGGFSAPGGASTKRRLLEIEGAVQPGLF